MSTTNYPQKKSPSDQAGKIVVVLGQTATGKSDLAVFLAKQFNGEIISADSRQVYKGMNLGTGKVPRDLSKNQELKTKSYLHQGIPHHLLDVASPSRRFSAAQYQRLGQAAIKKIQRKNKLPIICGGTGFYIRALVDGLEIPTVKPDFKLRARLEKKTTAELFKELKKLDPRRAKNIDARNPRRLIRALEIVITTSQPVPLLNSSQPPLNLRGGAPSLNLREGWGELKPLFLGLKKPRLELAQRIKIRLEKRLRQGMMAEVKKLRAQGLSWKKLEDFGLEYRWLARYLKEKTLRPHKSLRQAQAIRGEQTQGISYDETIFRLQKDIEHYAKRQITWFKRDERIRWIKNSAQAKKIVKNFLK